jgi:DNA (cytosine-5)-methyltransferase 1
VSRPRALDLFCGAGGASMGLYRAGFDVTGVDMQPFNQQADMFGGGGVDRYPFEFIQGDALTVDLSGYDLIWASPPCQDFTRYHRREPGRIAPRGNLIPAIRSRLAASGVAWIIENVEGAPLDNPVTLCGSMFGLEIRRHRLFETSFAVQQPQCQHSIWKNEYPCAGNRTNPRRTIEVGVWRIPLEVQQRAMGIDWMSLERLSQSIPPAYSEYLGRAAMAEIEQRGAA